MSEIAIQILKKQNLNLMKKKVGKSPNPNVGLKYFHRECPALLA